MDKEIALHWRNAQQLGAAYSLRSFLNGTLCTPILEDLRAVPSTVPMLYLWGKDNLLNPIQNAQKFLSVPPDIPLVPLKGAFYPHIEDGKTLIMLLEILLFPPGKTASKPVAYCDERPYLGNVQALCSTMLVFAISA